MATLSSFSSRCVVLGNQFGRRLLVHRRPINNALHQKLHGSRDMVASTSNLAFLGASLSMCRVLLVGQQRINQSNGRISIARPLSMSSEQVEPASDELNDADIGGFYASPKSHPDFKSLGITSSALLNRLESPPLELKRPSAIQAASFDTISNGKDAIIGAETGSGKTLAYLLPLVEDILKRKREWKETVTVPSTNEEDENERNNPIMDPGYDYARAIILVPNKELAYQAVRMAANICGGLDRCVVWGADALTTGMDDSVPSADIPEEEIVRLALLPGGLSNPNDFPPFRRFATKSSPSKPRLPPPDLVFATPANLGPFAHSPKNIDLFADIATLVVDEADMLLDGGYIRELNNVLMGFRRADRVLDKYDTPFFRKIRKKKPEEATDDGKNNDWSAEEQDEDEGQKRQQQKTQHVFVAATLPNYGIRSVDAYLNKKFPDAVSVMMQGMHNARHYGLENECQTVWNKMVENKDRMKRVIDVLRLDRSDVGPDGNGLNGEKVMIFLNSVNDVDGATNGLRRAGINAISYHAKIPLQERTSNLDKFRCYRAPTDVDEEEDNTNASATVPVLVCTDLGSRGLDIPGVTAVVQLQFATNVVSHLHRMGRCGRAGNRDGRGIIFYGPTEEELVGVVREAEEQQSQMTLSQDVEEELAEEGVKIEGKVQKAFSRKRGFTKKRKKERRVREGATE